MTHIPLKAKRPDSQFDWLWGINCWVAPDCLAEDAGNHTYYKLFKQAQLNLWKF